MKVNIRGKIEIEEDEGPGCVLALLEWCKTIRRKS
jgi:hypothetical protein